MKLTILLACLLAASTYAQNVDYPGAGNIGYDTQEDYPTTEAPEYTTEAVEYETTTEEYYVEPETTTEAVEYETTEAPEEETTTVEPAMESTTSAAAAASGQGRDYYYQCCLMAYQGQCDDPASMSFTRTFCQKSCGTYFCRLESHQSCTVTVDPTISVETCPWIASASGPVPVPSNPAGGGPVPSPTLPEVGRPVQPMPGPAPQPMTGGGTPIAADTPTGSSSGCADNNNSCSGWAAAGECDANPYYMKINCASSCKSCGSTYKTIGNVSGGCPDSNDLCPFWASKGECAANPNYMNENCKASCKKC